MYFRCKLIGLSRAPIYAAARWLLKNGKASPDDTVETWRGNTLSMSGQVGELAKWLVEEGVHGLRRRPFATGTYPQKTSKSDASATTLPDEDRGHSWVIRGE